MQSSSQRALRLVGILLSVGAAISACTTAPSPPRESAEESSATRGDLPFAPKVVLITLFDAEAQPWQAHLRIAKRIEVRGLTPDDPYVSCTLDAICLMTTGMGHTNATASVMALVLSDKFDLRNTYFIITGIAGIDPNVGTIGDATWARYLVDFGIAHEIDAREMPSNWDTGYFGIEAKDPWTKPALNYKTELFRVDERFLQRALALSRTATLSDTQEAQTYRALYTEQPARRPPSVIQCDTSAGDTYWHGRLLGIRATRWTSLLTDGKGIYCTTQQEDNGVYEALKRGASAGLLDLKRFAVMRTAANFDRPHAGQSAYESLKTEDGGLGAATENLYNAGWPVVNDIVTRWSIWAHGVPDD